MPLRKRDRRGRFSFVESDNTRAVEFMALLHFAQLLPNQPPMFRYAGWRPTASSLASAMVAVLVSQPAAPHPAARPGTGGQP